MQRSKNRRLKQNQTKGKKVNLIVFLILTLFVIGLTLVFWKVYSVEKFAFVNKGINGDAEIIIFDPSSDSINVYVIPGSTLLVSSRSLGEYRLDNLWILGVKEGVGGKIIAESISKNYSIPLYYWKDGVHTNLDLFKYLRSNLILKSPMLEKTVIESNKLSNSVLVNFVDNEVSELGIEIEIEDLTGNTNTANEIGKILEIIGTKITSYSKGYNEDLDCEVIGANKKVIDIISKELNCKSIINQGQNNVIQLRLGAKFVSRF